MIYLLLSWDLVFGDVVTLTPGYLLTLIYVLEKKGHILIILSAVYAVLWSLFYPNFLYLSPVIFIIFSLLSLFYNHKPKNMKRYFFLFYFFQLVVCMAFYNQFQIQYTQFIQLALYLLIFFHVKIRQDRK